VKNPRLLSTNSKPATIKPLRNTVANNTDAYNLVNHETADIPEISQLSVSEKLLLVEALWDDVRDDEALPLPAWHREALNESAITYNENPREGSTWADVKARLLSRARILQEPVPTNGFFTKALQHTQQELFTRVFPSSAIGFNVYTIYFTNHGSDTALL
jgi:putative addiction module component (TIGR02574 family)